jgi:hypothetical protein
MNESCAILPATHASAYCCAVKVTIDPQPEFKLITVIRRGGHGSHGLMEHFTIAVVGCNCVVLCLLF